MRSTHHIWRWKKAYRYFTLCSIIGKASSDDCQFVQPTNNLRLDPSIAVPTSELRIGTDLTCHFSRQLLKAAVKQDDASKISTNLENFLTEQKSVLWKKCYFLPAIKKCESDILKRLNLLRKGVMNDEAELWYAIANPIFTLLYTVVFGTHRCVQIFVNSCFWSEYMFGGRGTSLYILVWSELLSNVKPLCIVCYMCFNHFATRQPPVCIISAGTWILNKIRFQSWMTSSRVCVVGKIEKATSVSI